MKLEAWGESDIGLVRKTNQDAVGCFPDLALFVVADGMGGRADGAIASQLAVERLRESVVGDPGGAIPPAQGRPEVPMERVIGLELQVLGSHGMAAHAYPELLGLIAAGRLDPRPLITRRLALDDAGAALAEVGRQPGIAVVTSF